MRHSITRLIPATLAASLMVACTSAPTSPVRPSTPNSGSNLVDNRTAMTMTLSNGSSYSTQALDTQVQPGGATISNVYVTFDQVQVHYDASASVATPPATESADTDPGWITFPASTSQTIDLTHVAADSLFGANTGLQPGTYTQIRFKVKDAQVKLSDNSTASLDISSGNLKIIKPFEIKAGYKTTLHFDFDTANSINSANGAYRMRPTAIHTVPTYEALPAATSSTDASSSTAATTSSTP